MNSLIVYLVPGISVSEVNERLTSFESAVEGERIYWHVCENLDDYGDVVPPTDLFNQVGNERWLRVVIDYTGGLELVKRAVESLVSGLQAVVDNDHDDLMTAEEFVLRTSVDPGWDWRA